MTVVIGLCQRTWSIWSWVLHKGFYGRWSLGTNPGQNSLNYIYGSLWVAQAHWSIHHDTTCPRCWAKTTGVTVSSFGVPSCFHLVLPCCLPIPPLCSGNVYSAIALWECITFFMTLQGFTDKILFCVSKETLALDFGTMLKFLRFGGSGRWSACIFHHEVSKSLCSPRAECSRLNMRDPPKVHMVISGLRWTLWEVEEVDLADQGKSLRGMRISFIPHPWSLSAFSPPWTK